MGDLPFVVCAESADVWSHASQFQLHMSLGAPPDAYSADGQDWGLPAVRLARDGGRQPGAGSARAPATRRASTTASGSTTWSGYFRQWVQADGRRRARALRPGGDGRAVRARAARARRDARGAGAGQPRRAAARAGRGPRRHSAVRARRAAGARDARATASCRGRRTTTGASATRRRFRPRASLRGAPTTRRPSSSWWDELPERRPRGARRSAPASTPGMDERARTLALLRDLYGGELEPGARPRAGAARRCASASTRRRRSASRTGAGGCRGPSRTSRATPRVTARLDAVRSLVDASGR